MTNSERKLRQRTKKQLIEAGVLPPPKKRLNRKKYIEQAWAEYAAQPADLTADAYACLLKAISAVTNHRDRNTLNPSLEAIGAAKVLKLAAAIRKFERDARLRGEATYKTADLIDVINPILRD